jgi:Ca2+-binding EF-hand superfamily protein
MKPRVLDHVFSEEDEVEKLRLAFKEADHNLSGSLDINEFYCVLISYGM